MPRKPSASDLTDAQWRYLQRLIPRPARTGRPRADEREVLNGILSVLHPGCRWKDMPHDMLAAPKTCVTGGWWNTSAAGSGNAGWPSGGRKPPTAAC